MQQQAAQTPTPVVRREGQLQAGDAQFLLEVLWNVPVSGEHVERVVRLRALFQRMLQPTVLPPLPKEPAAAPAAPAPAPTLTDSLPRKARRGKAAKA